MKNGKYIETDKTCWYLNNLLHRKNKAAVEWNNGVKNWYLYGKLHREDGPAIIWPDGEQEWFINGVRHREDGPAIEKPNNIKQWCINGTTLTEEEFNQWLEKKNLNEKLEINLPEKSPIKRIKI